LLIAAVGLAFADASIVVLALPQIYGEFDTTIVGVSWVLTAYAVVVMVVALVVAAAYRRLRPAALVLVGLVVFAAASALCGVSDSLVMLMAGRGAQGAGAAVLLAGSLPVLCALLGTRRGRTAWSFAATVGLAVGPALGGLLTEAFEWRSIFLAQAPVAVSALTVAVSPAARRASATPAQRRPAILPNLGLIFLSGGLVGALFLSILLVIEVWRYSPVAGAAVVTALPAGMLLLRRAGADLGPGAQLAGGALLLGGGLTALAWLPATNVGWMIAALALCGAGLGLLTDLLDGAALQNRDGLIRNGSLAVAARHAGLVLGLVLIAPVLAGALDRATERSALAGTAVVLDARAPVQDKIKIALALRDQLDVSLRGEVPDLQAVIANTGVRSAAGLQVGEDLATRVEEILTRAFRPAFGVAAALGFAVLVPGLLLVGRRRTTSPNALADTADTSGAAPLDLHQTAPQPHDEAAEATVSVGAGARRPGADRPRRALAPTAALAVLLLGGVALLAAEQAGGAGGMGSYHEANPCRAAANPYPGGGLDAGLQRIALSAVNGAACDMHVSRERLVLALDGKSRFGGPQLDRDDMERALRAGLVRATEDAQRRGDVPGWALAPLRSVVANAPLSWFLDQLGLPGG
jgi:MFS family permease